MSRGARSKLALFAKRDEPVYSQRLQKSRSYRDPCQPSANDVRRIVYLQRDARQADRHGPRCQKDHAPCRQDGKQQDNDACRATGMAGWKSMEVEARVETSLIACRTPTPKEHLERGGRCASGYCPDQCPSSPTLPLSVSPNDSRDRSRQPEQAIARMGGDKSQEAQDTRVGGDGQVRRQTPVEDDET